MVCRDRLSSEGHNLSVYNTLQNAADVDAIRIALGYDQVNLYGASYGSHLAQAVMRDHPEGIRSAVIASVWPLEKSFSVDLSTTTSNGILRLLAACAADEACNGAYPNLQDVLFEVSDRLNAEPVPITLTHPLSGESYAAMLTGDAVVSNLVAFLYVTDIIPILPQAVYDVYNGDYQLMTQLSSTKLVLFEDLSRGVMFPTICTDDLIGRTPQDLLNVRAAVPSQLVGSADPELVIEYSVFNICENWPIEESAPWVKEPLVTDIPTLVLGSEFDPVTPPEYGRLVAGQLNDSYFFEFPGVGHNITVDECARNIAGNFMHNPTQIPDATCLEEMKGVVFELPSETDALTLEPFIDESRGFSGLVPKDWDELAPGNLVQSKTALVPAYFVLEAKPVPASELLASLTSQLGMGAALEPSATADLGNFAWSFYTFELQGNLVDLALAEDVEKAYFVFMMSPPEEHAALHEQLFLPAVEAMAPAT
jgi:pimeloyl-ACP methyl ester carboxylesterase